MATMTLSEPLHLDLERVNIKHHEQLLCYQSGRLQFLDNNFTTGSNILGTAEQPFRDCGSFLPFIVNHEHYHVMPNTNNDNQESRPITSQSMQDIIATHGKPLEVKQVVYDKPVAIIYNPVSGGRIDVREKILSTLRSHSIEAELFDTKYPMHAWDLAEKELDLSRFSVIAAVGGDGTLHQVVNGLMNRSKEEGVRPPPFSFLPNGSGNDFGANFGVTSLDEALDFLIKGEVIKMDCNLVTLDIEEVNADMNRKEQQLRDHVRYSIANSAVGWIANVNKKAAGLKGYVGGAAYAITGIKELLWKSHHIPRYDIVMEQPHGPPIKLEDLETMFFLVSNGKFAGGNINFTPAALLNDGLCDVALKKGDLRLFESLQILDQASRQQGNQVFRDDYFTFRAKAVTIHVKHPDISCEENNQTDGVDSAAKQSSYMYQVDGENLEFSKHVRVEAVPNAIDVVVNLQQLLRRGPMINGNEEA